MKATLKMATLIQQLSVNIYQNKNTRSRLHLVQVSINWYGDVRCHGNDSRVRLELFFSEWSFFSRRINSYKVKTKCQNRSFWPRQVLLCVPRAVRSRRSHARWVTVCPTAVKHPLPSLHCYLLLFFLPATSPDTSRLHRPRAHQQSAFTHIHEEHVCRHRRKNLTWQYRKYELWWNCLVQIFSGSVWAQACSDLAPFHPRVAPIFKFWTSDLNRT